jgi:hypothetical protein
MSNYTKTVNFAAKDALTTGDANKVVKGTEIDTEFNNIATAIATKYDSSTQVSLTTGVSGILPVANGGTGSASGVAASIVLAGTFSTGTYALNSSSLLRLGASSPSANWRLYAVGVNQGTGHPAIVADRENYADSSSLFCNDTTSGSGSRNLIVFGLNNTGYAAISTNGTTVTYGTSSDYRLKTNVMPLTDSTAKVKALKPCSYNWVKAPEISSQGFLAHELAAVVPQAVVGEKDAVNGDGSIKSQQVDLSYVIPLLTAALQEAFARIEALEAK